MDDRVREAIREAEERERRAVNMERDIESIKDTLAKELPALVESFNYQNGRVNRLESSVIDLQARHEDFEEYQFKPVAANVESVGDQVKVLYQEKVERDVARARAAAARQENIATEEFEDKRFLTRLEKWKSKLTVTTLLLAIIGSDELVNVGKHILELLKSTNQGM